MFPLLIASTTPVIIFLYLLTKKDKQAEPRMLLVKCFLGGFVVVGLALVVELLLDNWGKGIQHGFSSSFYGAFVVAAGTEEFFKWIVLRRIVWKSPHFDQHYDGIIYAVFVSLGFALIENIIYVFGGGMSVAVTRAILSVPGHGFYAVIMGYYLSLAKFDVQGKQKEYLMKSILVPILFHGVYDFSLFYMPFTTKEPALLLGVLALFTFIVIYTWKRGLQNIKQHLQKDGM